MGREKTKKTAVEVEPLAVILSDCHLTDRPNRSEEAGFAFGYGVDKAVRKKLPLILAGDILDKNTQQSRVVSAARRTLSSAAENIRIYFIQGQHEFVTPPAPLWLQAIEPRCVKLSVSTDWRLGRYWVVGVDHCSPDAFEARMEEVRQLGGEVILVAHQLWDEVLKGSLVTPTGYISQIPDNVAMLISGDYHKVINKKFDRPGSQPLRFLSPGSTIMQAVDEQPDKYGWVLYSDLSVKKFQLPSRPFVRLDKMVSDEDVDRQLIRLPALLATAMGSAAERELPGWLRAPLVSATCNAELAGAESRFREVIGESGTLHWREFTLEDEEQALDNPSGRSVVGAALQDCLWLAVDRESNPQLYDDLQGLVAAPELPAAVEQLWQTAYDEAKAIAEKEYSSAGVEDAG